MKIREHMASVDDWYKKHIGATLVYRDIDDWKKDKKGKLVRYYIEPSFNRGNRINGYDVNCYVMTESSRFPAHLRDYQIKGCTCCEHQGISLD